MKTILAIETSAPILSVALGTQDGKIKELSARGPLQHSENLIPLIDQLLKKQKLSLDKIDAFAIDRGPGSFTGLRIGFSLLKGFLAVRKRPCYGALSLDMIAQVVGARFIPSPHKDFRLGVLIDARRDLIYSRFYKFHKGEWVAEGKLKLLSLTELTGEARPGTKLAGDTLSRYSIQFEIQPALPSARVLVQWFQNKDRRLLPLKSPQDFIPLYFRASEAEEKRREKKL